VQSPPPHTNTNEVPVRPRKLGSKEWTCWCKPSPRFYLRLGRRVDINGETSPSSLALHIIPQRQGDVGPHGVGRSVSLLRVLHEEEPEGSVSDAGGGLLVSASAAPSAMVESHQERITCFLLNIAVAKLVHRGSFQSSFRHGITYGACSLCASAAHSWHIS
jgi:hypothetical protein